MSAPRKTGARGDVAPAATPDKPEKRVRQAKTRVAEQGRASALLARTDRIRGLYQDTLSEMKKINWPDQETTRNLTIVVIGISVVMGALLGGVDFALVKLLGLF